MIISNNTSIYGSVDVDSVSASVFEVNKTANVTVSAGQIAWNSSDATFDMGLENGVTLQVGQELHVYGRNFTSTTIPNGTAVYIISATGINGHLYFQKADNTNLAGDKVIAITTQAITGNSLGYATSFGVVRDLNTSALVEGAPFYLGTSGTLTSARPSWPNHSIRLGYCINVHPTSGEIYVSIHPEQAIEEIYDVVITSATQGDSFIYEDGKWINRNFGDITKDSTGFKNPESVIVTYDETTRKVTLTGSVDAYWRSNNVSALVPGWVSDAHPAGVSATQFLYYNGTSFVWSSVPWTFDMLQIAAVIFGQDGKYYFTLRETHGLMQHQVHKEFHLNIGTYLISGGDISSFVLNSTTVADRRPDVASMKLGDEDLETVLSSLTSKSYTLFNLSGTTRGNFTSASAEIVPVLASRPYYNQLVGSVWQQTLMPNNEYAAIFVMAVPVGSDTKSQNRRFLFIQPQTSNASLSTIQAVLPSSLNLNDLTYSPEYNFFGKIIIRYTASDWQIISVEKLSTSRAFISSTGGGYLSTVAIGAALSGNGTAGSPLNLIDSKTTGTYTKVVTNEYGIVTSGGTLTTADVSAFSIILNPTAIQTINTSNTAYLLLSGTTGSDPAIITRTSAFSGSGANSNFAIFTDGTMGWGPGNAGRDTNLYRSASGVLKTDTDFVARNISATTLTVASIDNTEFGYLNGVSANIQTQINTTNSTAVINQSFNVYNMDLPENSSLKSTVGSANITSGVSPFGNGYYNLINTRHRNGELDGLSGFGGQLAWGMTNYKNRMAFRTRNSFGWESWNELWSTANLPTSSVNNYTNTYNLVNSTSANWIVKNPTAFQTITTDNGRHLLLSGAFASDAGLAIRTSAASSSQLVLYSDGKIEWGGGTSARDTNLYRPTSGTLKTDGTMIASNFNVGANQIIGSRKTGWTSATGTPTRTTFDTTTVTTEQLAERVKALIDDLIAHGIIGS